jgi:succinyl-CoA synthetase beta subunit
MNIHEHQAKKLFADYGIPVPDGHVAASENEANEYKEVLGGSSWMVKAQVHAGGRGKAGGVKFTSNDIEFTETVNNLLGKRLVTHQTGTDGQPIHSVLIETPSSIARELYLSMVVDRSKRRVSVIASRMGGMNIEEVADKQPEEILTYSINPITGIQANQCRACAFALNLEGKQVKQFSQILTALYKLFIEKDLSLLEINPLIVTTDGDLLAIDAKINLDDSALYKHQDLAELYDATQVDAKENAAREFDLNYIVLDGNIACMVNGAGLAMATMDIIKLYGGEPANFLDVGGGTTADKVAEAFKLILSDDKVEAILVNIFGGIVRCDLIAQGILQAVAETGLNLPVVVRLEGTNVELGKKLLNDSSLDIITADNLSDAAQKVVNTVK